MHDHVEPGDYCYKAPGMVKPIHVTVTLRHGQMIVLFEHNGSGIRMKSIPYNAEFVKKEVNKPCTV